MGIAISSGIRVLNPSISNRESIIASVPLKDFRGASRPNIGPFWPNSLTCRRGLLKILDQPHLVFRALVYITHEIQSLSAEILGRKLAVNYQVYLYAYFDDRTEIYCDSSQFRFVVWSVDCRVQFET